jgi:hypothetical protein
LRPEGISVLICLTSLTSASSNQTGVSVKTVEHRISRALRRLEISLADYLPVYIGLITYLFATWQ